MIIVADRYWCGLTIALAYRSTIHQSSFNFFASSSMLTRSDFLRFLLAVALVCAAGAANGQAVTPSPQAAEALLAEVRVQGGEPGEWIPSTGTLIGHRNDSVYIVTARHSVKSGVDNAPLPDVLVRLHRDDVLHPASVRWIDSVADFAVLAAPISEIRGRWRAPHLVPPRLRNLFFEEPVFALGCVPACWFYPPQPGIHLHTSDDGVLHLRADYLEQGFSGGPVVDREGGLRGMIINSSGVTGTALSWNFLKTRLISLGFPVNLEPARVVRDDALFLKASIDLFPHPGEDLDGMTFFRGARIEGGFVLEGMHELSVGVARISITEPSIATAQNPNPVPDAFVAQYMTVGYQYRFRIPFVQTRRPHTLAAGITLMGLGRAWGVTRVLTDSIDNEIGEPALVRSATRVSAPLDLAVRGEYRFFLSEKAGVSLEGFAFRPSFDLPQSRRHVYFLALGADLRTF